ncbi:cytochrome b [Massilia sp. TSP1-1-2]|uniref:cytochrome b n=1 Tax=unclassified Massilia TaxID=2609279 RepID=UPI003CF0EFD1
MNWRNSPARYGWLAISLHWLMLVLLVAVYLSMELRGYFPKGSAERDAMKTWHYMLGLSVLVLASLRLAVHLRGPAPAISPSPAAWQTTGATLMKAALYIFMLAMPLLGWLILSAKGSTIPFFGLHLPPLLSQSKDLAESIKEIHETIATLGYVLVGLHAAAALYHHYFLRDDTLRRMLPK